MIFSLVLFSLVLGGIATSVITGDMPTTTPRPDPVSLDVLATVDGDTLHISGSINVPDGAVIDYQALLDRDEVKPIDLNNIMFDDGKAVVSGGTFAADVDISTWDDVGTIEVWVGFQVIAEGGSQPAEIVDMYGELGSLMRGPDTVTIGQLRRAEKVVHLRRNPRE